MISIRLKSKKVVLLLSVVGLLFTGCGDNPKEPVVAKEETSKAPIIEVVENKNAKEIKVEEKTAPDSQNKSYYLNYNVKSAYDENSQPANKDASVRVKPRTSIDAQLHIRSPYEKVKVSLLVRKLSKKFIIKCSACHNDYANGIIGPSLLDKTSDEILEKIAEFKSGKKSNPLMNDLIKMMSEDEIKELADEIYSFNQEIKKLGK